MEVYDLRLRGTHRFPDGKTPFVVVGVEEVEAGVVTQNPSPDFTIEINSGGLTMIRCHRMLTPESRDELRGWLDRLAAGEGRAS